MELAEIILAVFVVGVLMLLFRKTKVTKRHLSTTEWKKIIDEIAFALCEENNLPIYVFDMNRPGNLLRVVNGEPIGTEIC